MKQLFLFLVFSITSISSFYARETPHFSQALKHFQQNQGQWITFHCQHIQLGEIHYYGVRVNDQMQKPDDLSQSLLATRRVYQEMKQNILQKMGLSSDTEIVQVVGDSSPFSQEGTKQAKEFLSFHLPVNGVVLYGYTGHETMDGTRCVNAAVSNIMAERGHLNKTIGNLVGFHTPMALNEWGSTGPELQHYIVVYSDDESSPEKGTAFGDDITTSDFFADRLLVLDGGAQSFMQICNALLLDQKINILSGLRTPEKSEVIDSQGNETPYFSASQFLHDIASFVKERGEPLSERELQQWYHNYFGPGKCYAGDPQKPDFNKKQKMIDESWAFFIQHRLDRKLETLVETNKL